MPQTGAIMAETITGKVGVYDVKKLCRGYV